MGRRIAVASQIDNFQDLRKENLLLKFVMEKKDSGLGGC